MKYQSSKAKELMIEARYTAKIARLLLAAPQDPDTPGWYDRSKVVESLANRAAKQLKRARILEERELDALSREYQEDFRDRQDLSAFAAGR